jgi:hypothetical protein
MPVHGVFTVTLEPKGEGTALAFDYAVAGAGGKGAQLAPVVDKVVGEQLARLAALFGTPKPAAKVAPRDEVSLEKPAVEAPAPEVAPASVADAPAADVTVAGAPVPDVAGAETTAVEASVEKKVAPAKIQPKARSKAKARARPIGRRCRGFDPGRV